MATDQNILSLILDISTRLEGFSDVTKTVKSLTGSFKEESAKIGDIVLKLNDTLSAFASQKINTTALSEELGRVAAEWDKMGKAVKEGRVNKAVRDQFNDIVNSLKLLVAKVEEESKALAIKPNTAGLAEAGKAAETFADRFTAAFNKVKEVVAGGNASGEFTNISNALKRIGESGEVGKRGLSGFVKDIATVINNTKNVEIGKIIGEEFLKELKSRVTQGHVNKIFEEAFNTGNTDLLRPLKTILGDASFLSKFGRYVKDTFGDAVALINGKVAEAGKSLQTFGAHTIESESRLEGFRAGIITTTNEVRQQLEVFANFGRVQEQLNKLFGEANTNQNAATFIQYGNAVKTTEEELSRFLPLLQQIDKSVAFDPSITQVLELSKALTSVSSRLGTFNATVTQVAATAKESISEVVKESQNLGLTTKLQEQLTILSSESTVLRDIKTQLEQVGSVSFNTQQMTAQLELQQVAVKNLLLEVERLKTEGGDSPLLNSMIVGLGLAQTNITELQNRLALLPAEADKQAKAIGLALANATKDVSQILDARIAETTRKLASTGAVIIPPIQVKTIEFDNTGIKTIFDSLMGLISGLNSNWNLFKNNFNGKLETGDFDALRTVIDVLVPAFDKLRSNASAFGELFNTSSAVSNLYAVEKALEFIGKATGENLQEPIKAVQRLHSELNLIEGSKDRVKTVSDSLVDLQTPIKDVERNLAQITVGFKQLEDQGKKASPSDYNFERTAKTVDGLIKRLGDYEAELVAAQSASTRLGGTQIFSAELRNQISAALADITSYTTTLGAAKTALEGFKETRVDTSTTDKEFVKLGKTVKETVQDIVGGLNRLGDDTIYNNVKDHIGRIISSITNQAEIKTAWASIESLFINFSRSVKENPAKITVEGYSQASREIINLIDLMHEYANSKLAALRIEAEANPNNANLAAEIELYKKLADETALVSKEVADQGKAFVAERDLLKLHTKAVEESSAAFNNLHKNLTETGGKGTATARFADLAKSLRDMGTSATTSIADINKLIKALEEYSKTSKTLPANVATAFETYSVDKAIEKLHGMKEAVEDTNKTFAKQVTPLLSIESELKTITELTNKAFAPPTTSEQIVNLYKEALGQIKTRYSELAASAGEFASLQDVFSKHKSEASVLFDSINGILTVLRQSTAATVTFGDTPIDRGELIKSLETIKREVTGTTTSIGAALQTGGAALNYLLTEAGGGRLEILTKRFEELEKRTNEAKAKVSAMLQPGAVVSDESIRELRTQLNQIIRERAGLLKDIQGGTDRLNAAYNAAVKSYGEGNVTVLKDAVDKSKALFDKLKGDITALPAHVSDVTKPLENIDREFQRLGKGVSNSINEIIAGLTRLGDPSIYTSVKGNIRDILDNITNPKQLQAAWGAIEDLFKKFGTGVRANVANVSIEGFDQTSSEIIKLIELMRDYASAKAAALRIELMAKPNDPYLTSQITQTEDLIRVMTGVSEAAVKQGAAFNAERDLLKLHEQAVKNGAGAFSDLYIALLGVNGALNDTKSFTQLSDDVLRLGTSATTSIADINKLIKALENYKKTSDDLPPSLANKFGTTVVDEAILDLHKLIGTIQGLNKEFAKPITPLLSIETELRAIGELTGTVFTTPTQALDFVKGYDLALEKVATDTKAAANAITDFSGLQRVYADQKTQVDNLFNSLERVLTVLRETSATKITIGSTSVDKGAIIKDLEDLKTKITENANEIRIAAQNSGAALDNYLLTAANGSRYQEIEARFKELSTGIKAAMQSVADLQQPGVATTESVRELKTTINQLVKEREALLKEVNAGIQRMERAYEVASTHLDPGNVAVLKLAVDQAVAALKGLDNALPLTITKTEDLVKSFKGLETAISPAIRFNEALAQMDALLQRAGGGTAFDQAIAKLIKDLDDAKKGVGLVKSELESQPKEVLKTYLNDLTVKAEELRKAYIEVLRSMRDLQSSGAPVDSLIMKGATDQAEQLRLQIASVGEAMSTLKMLMSRAPEAAGLNLFEGVATSMAELRDGGALLSKMMKGLFESLLHDTKLKNIAGSSAEATKQFELLSEKTKLITASFRELEDKLVSGLRNMDMMTMGLQMIGQAMLEPFKKATEGYIKFSDTMAFTKGVTSATNEQMQAMTETAVTLGSTTRMSAEQAADALKQLALAGYSVQDSMAVLPTVIRVAQAAEMQLSESTGILVNIMQGQRMGVEQIGRASDVLSLAANRTTATFSDMGTSFKYIGALAATSKNDFEDTAAAIGLLHNAGLRGSMAGTALRGVLQALLNPTRDEAKVMGDLGQRLGGTGLQVLNAQGKFVGFRRIIEQFERASISTGEILELFGQRAGPGMAALLQVGSKAVGDLEQDLRNADGTTSRLSQNMEETFGGKLAMMKNSLSAFGDIVGHAVSKPLGIAADFVAGLTQRFVAFGEAQPELSAALIDTAGAIALLIAGFGSLSLAMTMMMIPTLQFFKFLGTASTVIFKTSGLLMSFRAGLLGVSAAALANKESLQAAIKAASGFKGALGILLTVLVNPYFLAFAAIAGVIGYAIYKMTKSTAVSNAELEKQRQSLANTTAEFNNLNNKITETVNRYQALREEKKGLSPEEFADLPEAKAQLNAISATVSEYIERINESGLANDVFTNRILDATGKTVGLKVTLKSTGEVIADVYEGMLEKEGPEAMKAQFNSLGKVLDDFTKKRDAALFASKLQNQFKPSKANDDYYDADGDDKEVQYDKDNLQAKKHYDEQLDLFNNYKVKLLQLEQQKDAALKQLQLAQADPNASKGSLKAFNDQYLQLSKQIDVLTKNLKDQLDSSYKSFFEGGLFTTKAGILTGKMPIDQFLDNMQKRFEIKGKELTDAIGKEHEKHQMALEDYVKKFPAGDDAHMRKFFKESVLIPLGKNEAEIEAHLTLLSAIFKDKFYKAVQVEPFETGVEKSFRNLQRTLDGGIKNVDNLLKGLATRSEEFKKVLDDYSKTADNFTKVREQYVAAGKATLDLNLSKLEQDSNMALDRIAVEGTKTSSSLSDSFIKWKNTSVNLTEAEANRFAVLQQQKVDIAKSASQQMYSVFSTSLRKQIDDLEREAEVTKNVYSIPERTVTEVPFGWADKTALNSVLELTQQTGQFTDVLVASEKAGYQFSKVFTNIKPGADAIKSYVADAKYSTGELLTFTTTFDAKLARARLYQEEVTLANKTKLLEDEKVKVEEYYNKILPLYAENTTQRIDKEIEFATKQKELTQKGYDNNKSTLDKLYDYHKQISDKIRNLKKDEAAFIASLDKINKKIGDTGKNDVQLLEDQKQQIRDLYQQAQNTTDLDERKARLVEIRDLMSNVEFQPWDEDTKGFLKTFTEKLRTDMPLINKELTKTGLSQQKSLEESGAVIETSQAKFQEMMSKFATDLETFAKKKQELEADLGRTQGINIESSDAMAQLTALEAKITNIRRLLETAPNVNLDDLSRLGELGDNLQRLNQDRNDLENSKLRLDVLQQQSNETNKLLGLTSALAQAKENYQMQSLGEDKITEVENKTVGELEPSDVEEINGKLRDRKTILDNLMEAYRVTGKTVPEILIKESEAINKASSAFKDGKDKTVLLSKDLLGSLSADSKVMEQINTDSAEASENSNKAMLATLRDSNKKVVEETRNLEKIGTRQNTTTQVRLSASANATASVNEAVKNAELFEDLEKNAPEKYKNVEKSGEKLGKDFSAGIQRGINLQKIEVDPVFEANQRIIQKEGDDLVDAIAQHVKQSPIPVTPEAKLDSATVKQSANDLTKGLEQFLGKKPVEVPTEIAKDSVTTTSEQVGAIKDKLQSLYQVSRKSTLLPEGSSQKIIDATAALDDLLKTKGQDNIIMMDKDNKSLAQAQSLLIELNNQATAAFSGFDQGNAVGKTLDQLEAMRTQLATQDLTNPDVKKQWEANTKELSRFKDTLETLKSEQTGTNFTTVDSVKAQQDLEGVGAELKTLATQFDEFRSKAQGKDFIDSEKTASDLKAVQDQYQQLNTQLSQGQVIDPSKLEEFKIKFDDVAASMQDKKIAVDVEGIQAAEDKLTSLQSLMSTVPTVELKSDPAPLDAAIERVQQLLAMDGRTTTVDVITNQITYKREGGIIGYQRGGFIQAVAHLARGGMAAVQRLATGGKSAFSRISEIVPGTGSGDTVPAMLEPGEFVVRKKIVQRYGHDFMQRFNDGLIQFRSLGGAIFRLPAMAVGGIANYVTPKFNLPEMQAVGGFGENVHLHFGNKEFIVKSPRDKVKDLVNAVKQLDRGY